MKTNIKKNIVKFNLTTNKVILFSTVALSFILTACFDLNNTIEKGKLSGSSWVKEDTYSGGASNYEYTYTIKFNSNEIGKYTKTGWFQVRDAATWKMGPKNQVTESKDFTYIYSHELKEGVIEYSSKSKIIFSISDDFQKMIYGGVAYTRK